MCRSEIFFFINSNPEDFRERLFCVLSFVDNHIELLEAFTLRVYRDCPEFFQRHRDRLHIIDEVLRLAKKGMCKTALMRKANLSYTQLTTYLQLLRDIQFVEAFHNGKNRVIITTKKGCKFIEHYEEIIQLFV